VGPRNYVLDGVYVGAIREYDRSIRGDGMRFYVTCYGRCYHRRHRHEADDDAVIRSMRWDNGLRYFL